MALNLQYIPAEYLQEYFVDKDTGMPLAGGIVTFYQDIARTNLKPVYTISGTPPNYTYVVLPNPLILSSVGTFQDSSGHDVNVYFYPYDTDGNLDLYYIKVTNASRVLQFTREGEPNITEEEETSTNFKNYIPNGQFALHNNNPATSTQDYGEVVGDCDNFAPGGWQFSRSKGGTSSNFIYFQRLNSWVSNPAQSPRYAVELVCTNILIESYKVIQVIFPDVNKFASNTDYYTFSFSAKNNITTSTVTVAVLKEYGSGGSTHQTFAKALFTIGPGWNTYTTSFTFGDNAGQVIGPNDDDWVAIQIYFPLNTLLDISLTDFILTDGQVDIETFPTTTDSAFNYESLFSQTSFQFDGWDLYLPLIRGSNGEIIADTSTIGDVVGNINPDAAPGWQFCDGTQLLTQDYWNTGVPHKRLFNMLWNPVLLVPRYGTGSSFVTAFTGVVTDSNELVLTTNKLGAVTNTADGPGAHATGFTFGVVHTGVSSDYGITAYTRTANTFYIVTDAVADDTLASDDYTISSYYEIPIHVPTGFNKIVMEDGTYITPLIEYNSVPAGSIGLASTYVNFQIFPLDESTSPVDPDAYSYWWYKVDGTGTDPAPFATGATPPVQVNIKSTDTNEFVEEKTRMSLNGWHVSSISIKAASTLSPGDYFTFTASTTNYYVWYAVDGVGADPAPAGKTGIEVYVLSTDTAIQVALKTQTAINSFYYAVPDFRGMFLRGISGTVIDKDANIRFSLVPGIYGATTGTFQFSTVKAHSHNIQHEPNSGGTSYAFKGVADSIPGTIKNALMNDKEMLINYESRPPNAGIYYYIKY